MADREAVADTLDAAADYMEEHGWCQNRYIDDAGRVCLLGAIRAAATLTGNITDESLLGSYDAVDTYLGAPTRINEFNSGDAAATWNDAEARTKEDVVTVLRKAAIQTREKVDAIL